jgi:hypothetical protein
MTPNGAFTVGLVVIALAVSNPGPRGLTILVVLALAFAVIEVRSAIMPALRRTALLVLPLAAFMLFVWVVIIGEAPYELAAAAAGTRADALIYVAKLCGRLFLIVGVVQLVFLRFRALTPLQLIRALALPAIVKRVLVITLSLIATLHHAIDRAHIALIAAGTLTGAVSPRNLLHGWRLIQAVWLSAVTIMLGRMRDKWPVENTIVLLDRTLEGGEAHVFAGADRIWLPITLGAGLLVVLADRIGGAL